jgi:hypothetical protein
MSSYYILRCLDAAGGTIRMIMQPYVDRNAAIQEAARSCGDCSHIEVVESGKVVWKGSLQEARAF